MRHCLAVFMGSLLLAATAAGIGFAAERPGFALVMGNSDYPDADTPLKDPVNDARALGEELRHRGFDVVIGENLKKAAMQKLLDSFYTKITPPSMAVVFFSGFGIQSGRQSYLIPVDAQIWNEADVQRGGFSLETILAEMTLHAPDVKVVIIDASRRNPFERRFRSISAGLAAVPASPGTAVMFSASPDAVAETNPAVFAPQLVAALKFSANRIGEVLNLTRQNVALRTNGQQVPWVSSALDRDVTFGAAPSTIPPDTYFWWWPMWR